MPEFCSLRDVLYFHWIKLSSGSVDRPSIWGSQSHDPGPNPGRSIIKTFLNFISLVGTFRTRIINSRLGPFSWNPRGGLEKKTPAILHFICAYIRAFFSQQWNCNSPFTSSILSCLETNSLGLVIQVKSPEIEK